MTSILYPYLNVKNLNEMGTTSIYASPNNQVPIIINEGGNTDSLVSPSGNGIFNIKDNILTLTVNEQIIWSIDLTTGVQSSLGGISLSSSTPIIKNILTALSGTPSNDSLLTEKAINDTYLNRYAPDGSRRIFWSGITLYFGSSLNSTTDYGIRMFSNSSSSSVISTNQLTAMNLVLGQRPNGSIPTDSIITSLTSAIPSTRYNDYNRPPYNYTNDNQVFPTMGTLKENWYTKVESDNNYYNKTHIDSNYYTKTNSDSLYLPINGTAKNTVEMTNNTAATIKWESTTGSRLKIYNTSNQEVFQFSTSSGSFFTNNLYVGVGQAGANNGDIIFGQDFTSSARPGKFIARFQSIIPVDKESSYTQSYDGYIPDECVPSMNLLTEYYAKKNDIIRIITYPSAYIFQSFASNQTTVGVNRPNVVSYSMGVSQFFDRITGSDGFDNLTDTFVGKIYFRITSINTTKFDWVSLRSRTSGHMFTNLAGQDERVTSPNVNLWTASEGKAAVKTIYNFNVVLQERTTTIHFSLCFDDANLLNNITPANISNEFTCDCGFEGIVYRKTF